ncbi:MAG: methyltransferase domain-containing protein [Ardenticatenaceae bacterium]|nr:methyltransferase domain-containing protein [Ardenticatenaceae bacterium]MCB8947958.1 methyltransferase domain-containing protein [Ardenticatenaceae bacterium]
MHWIAIVLTTAVLALLLYWLLITTEGVYLGRRVVVWLYDITAHKYDGIKEFDEDAEQFFLIRPLLVRLRPIPNPLVLDVATGTGRLPGFLLDAPTFNGRVVGLDASRKMLSFAAEKLRPFGPRASLVQQVADKLPFADNQFDLVTCLEALEFFPSDTAALQEMIRVLKPGGTLLVTRRKGPDAKLFVGRYRNVQQFEAVLISLGMEEVHTNPWQEDYDQVFGRKPVIGGR